MANCIPEPGKFCKNEATYYVWFENADGYYGFMCDKHAANAVENGVRGNRVYQIRSIDANPEIKLPNFGKSILEDDEIVKIVRGEFLDPIQDWKKDEDR